MSPKWPVLAEPCHGGLRSVMTWFPAPGTLCRVALQLVNRQPLPLDLSALRAGGRAERTAFTARYLESVERLVTRLLGPRPDVADVSQDVMVAALQSVSSYTGDEAGLWGWLTGVTTNVVRGYLRKLKVRRVVRFWEGDEDPSTPAVASSAGPEACAAVLEAWRVVERFPVDERLAFTLRLFAGHRMPEVAQALGVSLATANRLVRRARQRFEESRRGSLALAAVETGGLDDETE